MNLFNEGKISFNKGKIHDAHITWEKIWKYGDKDTRKIIKGFIQLSGGLLNNSFGKRRAAIYLLEKARKNIMDADKILISLDLLSISKQIEELIIIIQDDVFCGESVNVIL